MSYHFDTGGISKRNIFIQVLIYVLSCNKQWLNLNEEKWLLDYFIFFILFWRSSRMCFNSIDLSISFCKCPAFCVFYMCLYTISNQLFTCRSQSLQELRKGGRGLMLLSVTVNSSYMMCLKENPPSLELWQVKSWISGLYCYGRVKSSLLFS